MPSPFPGMDPWLEAPALWPDLHTHLISIIAGHLNPQLRPRYVCRVELRVYAIPPEDPGQQSLTVPDVAVVRPRRAPKKAVMTRALEPSPPTAVLLVGDEVELREARLEIRSLVDDRVVCALELLSPTNKTSGSRGRDEYLAKRATCLRSDAHLLEIDLLRAGLRVPTVDRLPRADYMAHLSRVELRPRGEVWAWSVRDPAPVIPVPLLGEETAALDLGWALRTAYDRASYDLSVDYSRPPVPPLSAADARWAAKLIGRKPPGSRARRRR
jgi:hypothetical protein